ncbi:MAG: NUDIX domain-containing protein [Patescibacteria group bacterium]
MAHTHEQLCLTIAAFLVRDDKVLLVEHPKYSLWLAPGGHIDPGEDTDMAVYREILEECGYKKEELSFVDGSRSRPMVDTETRLLMRPEFVDIHQANEHQHVAFVYYFRVLADHEPVKSDEHTSMRWFLESELAGITTRPSVAWYAADALARARSDVR